MKIRLSVGFLHECPVCRFLDINDDKTKYIHNSCKYPYVNRIKGNDNLYVCKACKSTMRLEDVKEEVKSKYGNFITTTTKACDIELQPDIMEKYINKLLTK